VRRFNPNKKGKDVILSEDNMRAHHPSRYVNNCQYGMPSMNPEGIDSYTVICDDPGKNLWIGLGAPDLALDSTPNAWLFKSEDRQFRKIDGNTNQYGYSMVKDDVLECVLNRNDGTI